MRFPGVTGCAICFFALAVAVLWNVLSAKAGIPDMVGRACTDGEQAAVTGRNSGLTDYVMLSPNAEFPRSGEVRKITIHHYMYGNWSLESLGILFSGQDIDESSNYAIDETGRVALYVEEVNSPHGTASRENDDEAVVIRIGVELTGNRWVITDETFESLVSLCADICERNGIEALEWTGDGSGNLTTHSMFPDGKACPGKYLADRMPELADRVDRILGVG